jgi:hypothetical protein
MPLHQIHKRLRILLSQHAVCIFEPIVLR